jgi:hypothetical protein
MDAESIDGDGFRGGIDPPSRLQGLYGVGVALRAQEIPQRQGREKGLIIQAQGRAVSFVVDISSISFASTTKDRMITTMGRPAAVASVRAAPSDPVLSAGTAVE